MDHFSMTIGHLLSGSSGYNSGHESTLDLDEVYKLDKCEFSCTTRLLTVS